MRAPAIWRPDQQRLATAADVVAAVSFVRVDAARMPGLAGWVAACCLADWLGGRVDWLTGWRQVDGSGSSGYPYAHICVHFLLEL